jgi:uncharacterized integral membrane protein
MTAGNDPTAKTRRQKITVNTLGAFLITIGLIVLIFLDRMPLPLRLLVGLGDVVAGLVLLAAARQVFSVRKP